MIKLQNRHNLTWPLLHNTVYLYCVNSNCLNGYIIYTWIFQLSIQLPNMVNQFIQQEGRVWCKRGRLLVSLVQPAASITLSKYIKIWCNIHVTIYRLLFKLLCLICLSVCLFLLFNMSDVIIICIQELDLLMILVPKVL